MSQAVSTDRARDPVCRMWVDKGTSLKTEHERSNYYFCADVCLKQFQAAPARYSVACDCRKISKECVCGH